MNINGNDLFNYSDGAVIAIVAIAMVFLILLVIIALTELVTKLAGKEDAKEITNEVQTNSYATSKLNVNDEDAVVACLIASIDYRNETGKHIEVLSVREVK